MSFFDARSTSANGYKPINFHYFYSEFTKISGNERKENKSEHLLRKIFYLARDIDLRALCKRMDSSRPEVIRYLGGDVVHDSGEVKKDDVWVSGGLVIDPQRLFYEEKRPPDRIVDCRGFIVAPGFLDIQINGAFGVDFSSLSEEQVSASLAQVSKDLLKHGVTAYCPTIVTSSPDYYRKVLPLMTPRSGNSDGAAVLGVHCEGPFISKEKKGAHEESLVQPRLSPTLLQQCYGDDLVNIKIITVAPELEGANETIKWLHGDKGVTVSLGHSMAQLGKAEGAVKSGASLVTHLFNAMLPFHHRDPGIVGLLTSLNLEGKDLFYGIIADGFHTHETVLRIAYKANPKGVVLVTDAIAAMGLPDGQHSLGNMQVNVAKGAAKLVGTDTLAGSCATMDSCIRQFKKSTSCSVGEAILAASLHPATVLGLEDRKGTLRFGAEADMVILDQELNVQATCIAGEIVWSKPGSTFNACVKTT